VGFNIKVLKIVLKIGVSDFPTFRKRKDLEGKTKTCTCLLMIHHETILISDFALCDITFGFWLPS